MITRRTLLASTAALAAASALPARAWAAQTVQLGSARVDALSDGYLVLPGDFVFAPMPKDDLGAVLAGFPDVDRERLEPPCNVTLLRDGERTILFDVGSGPNFMPSAGKLSEALEAVEVAPEDVTHVIFTHAHPDHLWGVLDDFDEPLFPEAKHLIGRTEWDYWTDPKTLDTIGTARQSFAAGAARRLRAIEGAISFFADDEEIVPGVAAMPTPGHTPGHMSFEIRNGSESVTVIGDAIANHHVAFARPDWHSGSDQDEERAARTRTRLLNKLAAEKSAIVGFHLPGGGIGRVEALGGQGYRYIPAAA